MHLYIAACLVQFKKETIVYPDWVHEQMNEWMKEWKTIPFMNVQIFYKLKLWYNLSLGIYSKLCTL